MSYSIEGYLPGTDFPWDERADRLFWAKIAIRGEGECWPWMKGTVQGYGAFSLRRGPEPKTRTMGAHRIVFILTTGIPPSSGREVCHRCHDRPCCNPGHLYEGTRADNMVDMARAGRGGSQRLTQAQVLRIRELHPKGASQEELARLFGVSRGAIYWVLTRRSWDWLESA